MQEQRLLTDFCTALQVFRDFWEVNMTFFVYTFYPCGVLRRYTSGGRIPAQAHAFAFRVSLVWETRELSKPCKLVRRRDEFVREPLWHGPLPRRSDAGRGGRGRQGQARRGVLGDERSCRFATVTQRVARLLGEGWIGGSM